MPTLIRNNNAKPGRLITLEHESRVLRDNPLKDPYQRKLHVYLPNEYDNKQRQKAKFPVLFSLAGFTGSGLSANNWKSFEENNVECLDRLIGSGRMRACIVVFPDCYTSFGGNQYINSSAIGDYADYLNHELVPLIDLQFRTSSAREGRGCFGKSSGGYGAMLLGMRYPKIWGGVANHSGDSYFDFVYLSEWPSVLTHLSRYAKNGKSPSLEQKSAKGVDDGRVKRFLNDIWSRSQEAQTTPTSQEVMTLMLLAMAASYDSDSSSPNGFKLPLDLVSGEVLSARWKQWLRHDPINLVARYKKNLDSLRALYIDCGRSDQFHIHYGTRQLSQRLRLNSIGHTYHEFDGTHSGIDHRLDISLPFLAQRLM